MTTTDYRDRGQPSSWSSAINMLCSGAEDDQQRLIVISAGNTQKADRHLFPDSNMTDGIHDPGQAWNALCVGAYTEKEYLDTSEYSDWRPIAPKGDISPSSTTSTIWQQQWPVKPDVVLEGGNLAVNPGTGEADVVDEMWLLTTNYQPLNSFFTITGDTSAAAAQASRFLAVLQAHYPHFWPETLKALMVHSAEWTEAMQNRFAPLTKKENIRSLLCYCGYGVPNLQRALYSAKNVLTLIVQEALWPFEKQKSGCATREMHLHPIPWPEEVLRALGATEVEMRVTLSYFIEPNAGRRGYKKKYSYASHGLRFDVISPTETRDEFRKRINKAAREEEAYQPGRSDSNQWLIGPKLRNSAGSLISDRWVGTAAELADKGTIAVYPTVGWWKERRNMQRWDRKTRYALIISIKVPEIDVDIYTPVENQVSVQVKV